MNLGIAAPRDLVNLRQPRRLFFVHRGETLLLLLLFFTSSQRKDANVLSRASALTRAAAARYYYRLSPRLTIGTSYLSREFLVRLTAYILRPRE